AAKAQQHIRTPPFPLSCSTVSIDLSSPMPDPNLDDLLLQAAGRTVGKDGQSRQSNQRWQQHGRRAGGSYSGGSGSDGSDDGDSDSDVAPSNPRKRLPAGSQVPLKKRHQTGKGG
uniref:Uncharacterized protein n=1 Tax=Aegilops tauschii subsp. strangulata TaxID=200361 RepID=A0A453K1X9_AEGTS